MKTKKTLAKPSHRLFIRVRDPSKPILIDGDGKQRIPTGWIEVQEINLGSVKDPNKEVIEIKLEPIRYEDEEEEGDTNIFRRMFK
jgi:hypothetical protein